MRLPVVTIVFLFIFSFLIDLYICFDIKQIWKKRGVRIYSITSLLCYALLIVAISLPRREIGSDLSAIMWLLYTYFTIYFAKLVYIICSVIGRCFRIVSRVKIPQYPFRWTGLLLGLSMMGIMWIGIGYTRNHIIVNYEDFSSEKLPDSFEGYRIVQISDLHVGTWGKNPKFLKSLVDTINSLKPDLILFTGDLVNRHSNEVIPFMDVLSNLSALNGVYSILGNHDYGDYVDWDSNAEKEKNLLRLKDFQRKMGWKMLNNEHTYIKRGNDSILLIGVENWGEPPFPQYGDLDMALSKDTEEERHQNDSNFKILMSHNPEHWNQEVSKNTNIDLTLSGHTHAMQSMVKIGNWKWSPAKYRYEQWAGKYTRNNSQGEPTAIYVNIGAGEVGMPARLLGAYPEVTLITLKK